MATMRRVGVASTVSVVATIAITTAEALRIIVGAHPNGSAFGRWRQRGPAVVELPAVQFVTVLESRYISWHCREGRGGKVWMLKGVHGVNAGTPIQLQKLLEE